MASKLEREMRATFRPVSVVGDARALREAARARGHLRVVDSGFKFSGPTVHRLTTGQVVLITLGAVASGLFAGWLWRKHRERS